MGASSEKERGSEPDRGRAASICVVGVWLVVVLCVAVLVLGVGGVISTLGQLDQVQSEAGALRLEELLVAVEAMMPLRCRLRLESSQDPASMVLLHDGQWSRDSSPVNASMDPAPWDCASLPISRATVVPPRRMHLHVLHPRGHDVGALLGPLGPLPFDAHEHWVEYRASPTDEATAVRNLRRTSHGVGCGGVAVCVDLHVLVRDSPLLANGTQRRLAEDVLMVSSSASPQQVRRWVLDRVAAGQVDLAAQWLGSSALDPFAQRIAVNSLRVEAQREQVRVLERARRADRWPTRWHLLAVLLAEPALAGRTATLVAETQRAVGTVALATAAVLSQPHDEMVSPPVRLHRAALVDAAVLAANHLNALLDELIAHVERRIADAHNAAELLAQRWQLEFVVYGPFFVPLAVPVLRLVCAIWSRASEQSGLHA